MSRKSIFAFAILSLMILLVPNGFVLADSSDPEVLFADQLKKFPALETLKGSKAQALKLTSRNAREYRTLLKESWKAAEKPNFAGRYFVPNGIGCGTGCAVIFVIDWSTGEIFKAPRDSAFYVSPKSRLLIVDPFPEGYVSPPEFYEFRSRRFVKRNFPAASK